jgi:hypothetical protein
METPRALSTVISPLELAGANEVVHLGEGCGLGGAHRLVDLVELDEDVLVHLAASELLLARGGSEILPEKSSMVHWGEPRQIVMEANFCFS